jgi:prefoldin beta subunit
MPAYVHLYQLIIGNRLDRTKQANVQWISGNMGASMAAAVDAELAKFRALQEDMAEKHQTLQQLLAQQRRKSNGSARTASPQGWGSNIQNGGAGLLKNDLDDAKLTVSKRLEFIMGERSKVEKGIKSWKKKQAKLPDKANEMQGLMQQAAVEAPKAIAAQHARVSSNTLYIVT